MFPGLAIQHLEDDELQNPRSVSWNMQVDREVTNRLLVRLGYEERRTTRDLIVNPEFSALGDDRLVLSNRGSSRYRELQVVTKYRWQENRDFHLAYVRSRATGDLNDFSSFFGDLRSPVIRAAERGRLSFDTTHRLLLWGVVGLPFRLAALPVVDWRSGFPFSHLDENQNYVGQRNDGGRYPNFFSLDMQVMREVSIPLGGRKLAARVGIKSSTLPTTSIRAMCRATSRAASLADSITASAGVFASSSRFSSSKAR